MSGCDQEMCSMWTGDGCACAVFGVERVCYIDDCGKPATLVVPSYPDDVRLCADHDDLYEPEPWERKR